MTVGRNEFPIAISPDTHRKPELTERTARFPVDARTCLDYVALTSAKRTLGMGPPAMTVRGVAAYLNVDEKTVYRLAKRGELPGFKVAGTWRFKQQDIDEWIEQQKARAVEEDKANGG